MKNIICTAPTNKATGKVHPNTLYAMKKAGATEILALGGVQVKTVRKNKNNKYDNVHRILLDHKDIKTH